jgi:Nucleotidyltransferase of unknown function (DUF6036)
MQVQIPDPWLSFLSDVDQALKETVEVHCLGGFVLRILYGLPRPTADVDFVEIRPATASDELIGIAGEGSEIGRRHRLYFHRVSVADYPSDYEDRLIDITPRGFKKLRLRIFEVHDVVLAKVARNIQRDRADVEFLASKGLLNRELLKERFENELRPYLLQEERGVQTMQMWLGEFLGEPRGREGR